MSWKQERLSNSYRLKEGKGAWWLKALDDPGYRILLDELKKLE